MMMMMMNYVYISSILNKLLEGGDHRLHVEDSQQRQQQQQPKLQQAKNKRKEAVAEAKQLQDKEIEALLNRKAINEDSAESQRFNNLHNKLTSLEKREFVHDKVATSTHSISVKAFHCIDCDLIMESIKLPTLCKEKRHKVLFMNATKKFFECCNCNRRDSTINKIVDPKSNVLTKESLGPNRRCSCGAYEWRKCGLNGSGLASTVSNIKRDGKFVVTRTDWTDKGSLLSLDARVSNMD